ncbi:MAG: leucine-rich repeat domain-containing protein, partial [Thermoguttaceae bacterium]|nr:leucine-rich repeat domain-containing protein [Thermoguttaceae bacterium]
IPEGVTRIGNDAFRNCIVLRTVTIPDSVTSIGMNAFFDCTNLTSAKLPGNLKAIEKATFHNCFALTDIEIPNSVESLGEDAFSGCHTLEKLHIPDGVKSIGRACFWDCKKLQELHIPDSVKSIGDLCFRNCHQLQTVTLPKDLQKLAWQLFNACDKLKTVQLPNKLTTIHAQAFAWSSISSLKIPEGVTRIENAAFLDAGSLTSLTLPDSLEFIGEGVFAGCGNLKEINISKNHPHFKLVDGVLFSKDGKRLILCLRNKTGEYKIPQGTVEVDSRAFENCKSLTSVTIPESVSKFTGSFDLEPFGGCTQLSDIIVEEGNKHYKSIDGVLFVSQEKKLIQYPCARTGEYRIPEGTVIIARGAFCGSKATSIIIPEGVKQIQRYAFSYCRDLTYIRIPKSVEDLSDEHIFHENFKLSVIDLAKGNPHFKIIDDVLFTADGKTLIWCLPHKSGKYIIPEGVTRTISRAFNHPKLTSVTFPKGCVSIGRSAFEYNGQLTEAHIPASVTEIGGGCFCNCGANLTIYAPKGSKAEEYAKSNGHKFQAVEK